MPASISIPSSATGSYDISWGISSGEVSVYRLFEGGDANFANAAIVAITDAGAPRTANFTRSNGSYYYWVSGCNTAGCSAPLGGSAVIVAQVPEPPGSISVPSEEQGAATWSAPATTPPAPAGAPIRSAWSSTCRRPCRS